MPLRSAGGRSIIVMLLPGLGAGHCPMGSEGGSMGGPKPLRSMGYESRLSINWAHW